MATRIKNDNILRKKSIKNQYFNWLCSLVQVNWPGSISYWFLAGDLYKREFFWTVPYDDNRAEDGKKLRELFLDEFGYENASGIDGPCTVFEMMIALAMRFDMVMADLDNTDQTVKWFWKLIENLGLLNFTDENYFDLGSTVRVNQIVDRLLERTYTKSGRGGLFPLNQSKEDQRRVEIWYQMSEYILENYYLDGEKV